MDNNLDYVQNSDDEISLKELFMALWRQKILIISITLIAAILTGVFSVFVLTPVYHAKLNILINMPETYTTRYGDYSLPLTTNQQYINLITSNSILVNTIEDMGYDPELVTIEAMRERITIGQVTTSANQEQNSFEVKVAADNPEEARELASTLYDNYIKFVDVMTIEGAIKYFTNDYEVRIRSAQVDLQSSQEILIKNEGLLSVTPQTINQKEAANEISSQGSVSNYIILENIINPNYTMIEADIIANKQSINTIENNIGIYNNYLTGLNNAREIVSNYYVSGDFTELNDTMTSVVKTSIYLPSEPIAPSSKTSPSNAMNIIIGGVLGGMVSVLIALIKEYWFSKEEDSK